MTNNQIQMANATMSTIRKLDRTQVELFNSWNPHEFKRVAERQYPGTRQTYSQLGPRPSDFIICPDWVSEDVDKTHAFSGRTHRPWNFEFPGARDWPNPRRDRSHVSQLRREMVPQRNVDTIIARPPPDRPVADHAMASLDTDLSLPPLMTSSSHPSWSVTSGNQATSTVEPLSTISPFSVPANRRLPGRMVSHSVGQEQRYLPYLQALKTSHYTINKPNQVYGNPASSRYFAFGQKDFGSVYAAMGSEKWSNSAKLIPGN